MITEFKGEYSWLSNFAPVEIQVSTITYPSVEHAYMSCKSDDAHWKTMCADTRISPGKIKQLSKHVNLRKDWETVKVNIMLDLLKQKFNKEPYRSLLLETDGIHLQEGNWWGDSYWGIDLKTDTGMNLLGKSIMTIRKQLLEQENMLEDVFTVNKLRDETGNSLVSCKLAINQYVGYENALKAFQLKLWGHNKLS